MADLSTDNKIHRSEGFAHCMLREPFYYRKHVMGIIYNHCPIVPRSDFQSAYSQRLTRVLEIIMYMKRDEEKLR